MGIVECQWWYRGVRLSLNRPINHLLRRAPIKWLALAHHRILRRVHGQVDLSETLILGSSPTCLRLSCLRRCFVANEVAEPLLYHVSFVDCVGLGMLASLRLLMAV